MPIKKPGGKKKTNKKTKKSTPIELPPKIPVSNGGVAKPYSPIYTNAFQVQLESQQTLKSVFNPLNSHHSETRHLDDQALSHYISEVVRRSLHKFCNFDEETGVIRRCCVQTFLLRKESGVKRPTIGFINQCARS